MLSSITDTIALVTAVQLLLFAVFLLAVKKNRTTDKIALALFLLSNSIFIINFLALEYSKELLPFFKNFLFIGTASGFLFGPLLYLYTRSVTRKLLRFRIKDILHIVLFVLVTGVILYRYTFRDFAYKMEVLTTGLFSHAEYTLFLLSMNLVTFGYLYACFRLVKQRNKDLETYYSSTEKINFDWLKIVVTAFFLMWMADLTNWLLSKSGINTPLTREILNFISLLINFVFANLLIFKNLRLPRLEDAPVKTKYESSPLTEKQKEEILCKAETMMGNEKLYLNPSLNLGEAAGKLGVPPRHLSQVINELRKQNFYDFVNTYRIDEVKRLLLDPEYVNEKILAVSFDCGFNSKSVFNTVFKKYTGLTPTEYRRKYNRTA